MLHLRALGWGLRRIAREFGCSKNTVRRYVAADGWMTYSRRATSEDQPGRGRSRSLVGGGMAPDRTAKLAGLIESEARRLGG